MSLESIYEPVFQESICLYLWLYIVCDVPGTVIWEFVSNARLKLFEFLFFPQTEMGSNYQQKHFNHGYLVRLANTVDKQKYDLFSCCQSVSRFVRTGICLISVGKDRNLSIFWVGFRTGGEEIIWTIGACGLILLPGILQGLQSCHLVCISIIIMGY